MRFIDTSEGRVTVGNAIVITDKVEASFADHRALGTKAEASVAGNESVGRTVGARARWKNVVRSFAIPDAEAVASQFGWRTRCTTGWSKRAFVVEIVPGACSNGVFKFERQIARDGHACDGRRGPNPAWHAFNDILAVHHEAFVAFDMQTGFNGKRDLRMRAFYASIMEQWRGRTSVCFASNGAIAPLAVGLANSKVGTNKRVSGGATEQRNVAKFDVGIGLEVNDGRGWEQRVHRCGIFGQ